METPPAKYTDWLAESILKRRFLLRAFRSTVRFSILTSVYERTNHAYFSETRDSVLSQENADFEWIVLSHGRISNPLLAILRSLESNTRCSVFYLPENLEIIGGMRFCLEAAQGDYVAPLDADDLLTPDALAVMDTYIQKTGASFLYSDEDILIEGAPTHPYIRPDWDPALLTTNSYIWHLCTFRRDQALQLDVYGDTGANWCHDWDTALRFHRAGLKAIHVPHVLHHWRAHAASSTNRPDPESGSLKSQRYVLERVIATQQHPDHFTVEESPLFRGAFEWWIRRMPVDPPPVDLVISGTNQERALASATAVLRRSVYPFRAVHLLGCELPAESLQRLRDLASGQGSAPPVVSCSSRRDIQALLPVARAAAKFAVICGEWFWAEGALWPWECDKLFELHSDVAIVAGRLVNAHGHIIGGPEIFGFEGLVGSPDESQLDDDPGYFAISLKQRSVSAPYSELFAVRTDFLCSALPELPQIASWQGIGMWLGAMVASKGLRVVYTPVFTARLAVPRLVERVHVSKQEGGAFACTFPKLIPDHRWYSLQFGWRKSTAYCVDRSYAFATATLHAQKPLL